MEDHPVFLSPDSCLLLGEARKISLDVGQGISLSFIVWLCVKKKKSSISKERY